MRLVLQGHSSATFTLNGGFHSKTSIFEASSSLLYTICVHAVSSRISFSSGGKSIPKRFFKYGPISYTVAAEKSTEETLACVCVWVVSGPPHRGGLLPQPLWGPLVLPVHLHLLGLRQRATGLRPGGSAASRLRPRGPDHDLREGGGEGGITFEQLGFRGGQGRAYSDPPLPPPLPSSCDWRGEGPVT